MNPSFKSNNNSEVVKSNSNIIITCKFSYFEQPQYIDQFKAHSHQ